jgi:hypothetical protein
VPSASAVKSNECLYILYMTKPSEEVGVGEAEIK